MSRDGDTSSAHATNAARPNALSPDAYYGQLIIGPPGAGKTSYARRAKHYLQEQMGRQVIIVNMDPGSDDTVDDLYDIDICELIQVTDTMQFENLGPNGSILFCMNFLEQNCCSWLCPLLKLYDPSKYYFLFDCAGQVELQTHHPALQNIIIILQKELNFRLCAVHLIDSHHCGDPAKFIAVLLVSLTAMMRLSLPHINVLSKIDLLEKNGPTDFNLDYYADVLDLSYLIERLNTDQFTSKYVRLNQVLCDTLESYALVSFTPLELQDDKLMHQLQKRIDKANGYFFSEHLENMAAKKRWIDHAISQQAASGGMPVEE